MKRYPDRMRCAKCDGVVRPRLVTDPRYEPAQEWAPPPRCSHCGADGSKLDPPGSIWVLVVDRPRRAEVVT